ncbi:Clp protease N-terminal domain-containing protein [Micromonospora sp. URMC 103]|uniref:Clp protease N-terminal domain-containing protein n=1 Tax=Micromonospora sp. URMC 103 TaxID=3423406 RepID=UPI003F1B939B
MQIMRNRVVRLGARSDAHGRQETPMWPHETEPFVALGAPPMMLLQMAYEAAVRRRADSVGTLDVLAHLATGDKPRPQWLFADSRAGLARMVAEPHRMPTRRAAGELRPGPGTDLDSEVQAVAREVEWRARRMAGRPMMLRQSDVEHWEARPRWSAGVQAMLAGTLTAAREHAVPFADRNHLLLGMLRLPDCDGTRYAFPYEHARMAALERLSREPDLRRPAAPHPTLDLATMEANQASLPNRLAKWLFTPFFRLARVGPLLGDIRGEARRQAVRSGHNLIDPAHVLLAMLTADATLEATGTRMPAEHTRHNRGGAILRAHRVDASRLREVIASRGQPHEPPAEVLAEQLNHVRPGDPFEGTEVTAAWHRAMKISLAYRHRDTGTSHLLLALVEDGAGEAASILRAVGADVTTVRERVQQDLTSGAAA